jgi:CRISPR-associated protein Csx17
VKQGSLGVKWDEQALGDVIWHDGGLVSAMNAAMGRRLFLAAREGAEAWPDRGRLTAMLPEITAFIEGRVDDQRLSALLWGLCLIDWPAVDFSFPQGVEQEMPGAGFALMKLCFAGRAVRGVTEVPLVPEIHQRAARGDGAGATASASRRLRGSGLVPAVGQIYQRGDPAKRAAAALLFPLSPNGIQKLTDVVLRPETKSN